MRGQHWLAVIGLACIFVAPSMAGAQPKYIGYVYPAGGQQGTTFQIKIGGQNLDDVNLVLVSGAGVQARVTDYFKRLGNQEFSLMREQLAELKREANAARTRKAAATTSPVPGAMEMSAKMDEPGMMESHAPAEANVSRSKDAEAAKIVARIEKRLAEYVQDPANGAVSSLAFIEVTIATDAAPGPREIRLATPRGVTNPMVFYVGQVPETARKPMISAIHQTLGKEELALRKRPPEEEEVRITLPCTTNGQIASGEVNRYRFDARKGQRLLLSVAGRSLNPYVADAVPGWFQPVLTLRDARGKELAYSDSYRFKPDPVILFTVPQDGTYVAGITDAIYRGREDFVYRLTIGELPFLTGIFPLGARVGEPPKIEMTGWNLDKAELSIPPAGAAPGVHLLSASAGALASNREPLVLDVLPEVFAKELGNKVPEAQNVTLPIIINGRIARPDDWDVFQFTGRAGETIVAEVIARRLDSPLDSVLKLTDETGRLLAMNDGHDDPEAGVNTHDADSYIKFKLPADGNYYVHLGDEARHGGPEYAYRLRLSEPIPDFALYVAPSSVAISSKGTGNIGIQAVRKDGYAGPITVTLKDPPDGFSMNPVTIPKDKTSARLPLKTTLTATTQPVDLVFEGRAKIDQRDVSHQAIAAEDRMQAFLWRHLVPALDLKAVVFEPNYAPPPKRIRERQSPDWRERGKPATSPAATTPPPSASPAPGPSSALAATKPTSPFSPTRPAATSGPAKPTFTKQQVAAQLRQLKYLYGEGLLTDEFYDRKVAECEPGQ